MRMGQTGKITVDIDCREAVPSALTKDMIYDGLDNDASTVGGLAIGVPGELRV